MAENVHRDEYTVLSWLRCSRFIRKRFTFKHPSFFDGHIEKEIREFLQQPRPAQDFALMTLKRKRKASLEATNTRKEKVDFAQKG